MIDLDITTLIEAWKTGGLLIALALVLIGAGLGCSESPFLQRVGGFLFPAAFSTAVFWWTESIALAIFTFVLWLVIPVVQAFIFIRQMRVPKNRHLESIPTAGFEFADLHELSYIWQKHGFEIVDDCELVPSSPRQVYRFLLSPDSRRLVVLGWVQQGSYLVTYSTLSSWAENGQHWMVSNCPLPYGLKPLPQMRVWHCPLAEDPKEIIELFDEFLELNEVASRSMPELQIPETAIKTWNDWIHLQTEYNLREGWLKTVGKEKLEIAYSLRGILGAFKQVFVQLIKT